MLCTEFVIEAWSQQ